MKKASHFLFMPLACIFLAGCGFMQYTYKQNKKAVSEYIAERHKKGIYPSNQEIRDFSYRAGQKYAHEWTQKQNAEKVTALLKKAQENFDSGEFPRALSDVDDAIDKANRANDAQGLANAFLMKEKVLNTFASNPQHYKGVLNYAELIENATLFQHLALSAAIFCKNTLMQASILVDSTNKYIANNKIPSPEAFCDGKGVSFTEALEDISYQRYAGYHKALSIYVKHDTTLYWKLLDSICRNNIPDLQSYRRLYSAKQYPAKQLFGLWKIATIYTQYIVHNNDFQYEMKYNNGLIDTIQQVYKKAYPLAVQLQDKHKQLMLRYDYIKTLQWQGRYDEALAENEKYAVLCGDTLHWANQLYAELYAAKYRRDSFPENLQKANLYFLNALYPQNPRNSIVKDTLQQITLLDSMLQYMDCEQTSVCGKKLLAMKERKLGMPYCYHVLMKLGDCEREKGSLTEAQRYYLKASQIYIYAYSSNLKFKGVQRMMETPKPFTPHISMTPTTYSSIYADKTVLVPNDRVDKTKHSIVIYTKPISKNKLLWNIQKGADTSTIFFLPKEPQYTKIFYVYRSMKQDSTPFVSDNWFCSTVSPTLKDINITNAYPEQLNQRWITLAENQWLLCELSQVQEKDTVAWINTLRNLLTTKSSLYRSNPSKQSKDSVWYYFHRLERLCKANEDIASWRKIAQIIPSELKEDKDYLKYEEELLNMGPDLKLKCKEYTGDEREKEIQSKWDDFYSQKMFLSLKINQPDSAIFYLLKHGEGYFALQVYFYQSVSLLMEKDMDSLAYSTLHTVPRNRFTTVGDEKGERQRKLREYNEAKIELLYLLHKKWGNADSMNFYKQIFIDSSYTSRREYFDINESLPDVPYIYKAEPFLYDLYTSYPNGHSRKLDLAQSLNGYAEARMMQALVAQDTFAAFQIAYHALVVACDYHWWEYAAKYADILNQYFVSTQKDTTLLRYRGLAYTRLANELLKQYNFSGRPEVDDWGGSFAYDLLIKAGKIAEQIGDERAKISIGIILFNCWGYNSENNPYRKYLSSFSNKIDTTNNNLYYYYAKTKILESYQTNNVDSIIFWHRQTEKVTFHEFPVFLIEDIRKGTDYVHFGIEDSAHYYVPEHLIRDKNKDLILKYWACILEEDVGDDDENTGTGYAKRPYFKATYTSIDAAISWAFQENQTQITQKTDSLQSANLRIETEKNKAKEAQETAEKAQVKEVQQRVIAEQNADGWKKEKEKSDSLSAINIEEKEKAKQAQEEAECQKDVAQENEKRAIFNENKAVGNEQKARVSAQAATRNMKGATATAGLFLCAFFGAVVFYRRSERQKAEIEWQQEEFSHRVANNLQALINPLSRLVRKYQGETQRDFEAIEGQAVASAKIYRFLHDRKQYSRLDMKAYLREFMAEMTTFYQHSYPDFHIEYELPDFILEHKESIKMAKLFYELVHNACKHAFEQDKNTPKVSLRLRLVEGAIQCTIWDSGKGIAETDIKMLMQKSTGMRLVGYAILALGGDLDEVRIENQAGTTISFYLYPETLSLS